MQNTWKIVTVALLLTVAMPLALADEPEAGGEEPTTQSDGPCYAVDWTMSPPRVYEVPCDS